MEDEALPVVQLRRLSVANIHQFASVESLLVHLLNDENGVVQLLLAKKTVEIEEKLLEVGLAVAETRHLPTRQQQSTASRPTCRESQLPLDVSPCTLSAVRAHPARDQDRAAPTSPSSVSSATRGSVQLNLGVERGMSQGWDPGVRILRQ